MDNIRIYNTLADYQSDAAAIAAMSGSVVSAVIDGTGVKYNGKNVVVPLSAAQPDDIILFDTVELKYKALKYGTYKSSTFPSRYIIGGVVYERLGDIVTIMAKDKTASLRYAQGYKVKLTGFDFSTGGSFGISFTGRATQSGTITYTSTDTLTTVAAMINALAEDFFNAVASDTYNCITIEHNDYYNPTITISAASPTITMTELASKYQTTLVDSILGNGLIKPYTILRNKGINSYYAGSNYEKFRSYYAASGASTTGLSESSSDILKESAFNATDNPAIYNKYAGNYSVYLRSEMLAWPTGRGVMRQFNSKAMSDSLAAKTWTDIDGTVKPAYLAAYDHKAYGITTLGVTTGFEPGNWYMGSVYDLHMSIKDRNISGTDRLNLSIAAVGGTKHLPSDYYWSCCEYSSNNAWIFTGDGGLMNNYIKYTTCPGRPLLALRVID